MKIDKLLTNIVDLTFYYTLHKMFSFNVNWANYHLRGKKGRNWSYAGRRLELATGGYAEGPMRPQMHTLVRMWTEVPWKGSNRPQKTWKVSCLTDRGPTTHKTGSSAGTATSIGQEGLSDSLTLVKMLRFYPNAGLNGHARIKTGDFNKLVYTFLAQIC